MRVLFVFCSDAPRGFCSSIAALAPVVQELGHECAVTEVPRERAVAEVVHDLAAFEADVVAFSVMTSDWPGTHAIIDAWPTPRPFVVVGGYHATFAPEQVARCEGVQAIAIGEAERSLPRLLADFDGATTSPGMWIRGPAGRFEGTAPAPDPEPDIDLLPPWDYSLFGAAEMLSEGVNTFGALGDTFLPTRASRGCPYTCRYCSAPQWGALHGHARPTMRNQRSVLSLCDELAALRDRWSPAGFEFWDEHFPVALPWLQEFARVYPERVGLPFKCEMHPRAATRERLALLVRAGCVLFHCGIEAGSERLRREVLGRRVTDAQLQRVFADCRELGLETSASLMTILPTETREEQAATTRLLEVLQPDSFMFSTYQPLPGTPLGESTAAGWPDRATGTIDGHAGPRWRGPPSVSAEERRETLTELVMLQRAASQRAAERARTSGWGEPRRRPIANPSVPIPPRPDFAARFAWPGDIELVGLEQQGSRIVFFLRGAFGKGALDVAALPCQHYIGARHLGVSYRGADAVPELLACARAAADALADVTFPELVAMSVTAA